MLHNKERRFLGICNLLLKGLGHNPQGGVPGQSKSFCALFCAPTILEFWVKKGGGAGLTKYKSFWALFPNFLVKYDKKVPQNFRVKKCPKVLKLLGGGVRPGLENTQIKAEFGNSLFWRGEEIIEGLG